MRNRRSIWIPIAVALTFVVVATLWFVLSSRPLDFARLRNGEPFNVVVITLDTTRADRLGAYGFERVETPAIDAMARDGVLFRRAYSTTPMTLPSHTSLFSGTYPPHHGVRDNGGYLVPEELTTLAEVFQAGGYQTAAFIAAYVLDSSWGLDQGFDTYYDDFGVRVAPRGAPRSRLRERNDDGQRVISMGDVQRPANEVVDTALEWMDQKEDGPFFLWVHLYDPHVPYEAPEPYRTRYSADPYLAEIAFTDSEVGRLLSGLEERGEKDRTFVVLAGDHGESLGEHGETLHGFFIYEEATHVPLIFSSPFDEFRGVERDEVVSLIDIMPTILDMTGLEIPAAVQGESLTGLFDPGAIPAARFVYSEAFYARLHFGWSELSAIQDGRYKLIMSSEPELYDLLEDPDEAEDLATRDTSLFDRLEAVSEELVAEISRNSIAVESAIVDEETLRKLVSLGYLGGVSTSADSSEVLASPREKIDIYNKSNRARQLMYREDYDGAERLFREVLSEEPGVLDVYRSLGQLYAFQQRFEEAEAVYRLAIPLTPADPYAYILLAEVQLDRGLTAEAETTMLDALAFVDSSSDIYCTLGDINRTQADYRAAVGYFEDCLRFNPASSAAYAGLAAVYLQVGERDLAEENARSALAINDSIPGAHFTLAQIHEAVGRSMQAANEYLQEIENSPDDTNARFNLAVIYRVAGKTLPEEKLLSRILEIDPEHPRALLFLGMNYVNRGKRYARAVELVTAAVAKPMETRELVLGYFLLADLYNRLGDPIRSAEYGRRGQALTGR